MFSVVALQVNIQGTSSWKGPLAFEAGFLRCVHTECKRSTAAGPAKSIDVAKLLMLCRLACFTGGRYKAGTASNLF